MKHDTYSSVVTRNSVRLCFLLAALNDLDVKMADIGNAYLNAKCKERIHVKCDPELFGPEHEGKYAVIVRALYGLKTSGNSWRNHFSTFIRQELKFHPTKADLFLLENLDSMERRNLTRSTGCVDNLA